MANERSTTMPAVPSSPAGLERLVDAACRTLRRARSLAELERLETEHLGRRSALARLKHGLAELSPDERHRAGAALNAARDKVEAEATRRRGVLERREREARLERDRLDLTEVLPGPGPGHLHLVTQVRAELEDIFVGMGYEIAEGPEAETDWYNFAALNIPRDHPARSGHDSFYLALSDEESVLLRTHTSPVQVHLLERGELPVYAVMPGRVFRRDTPDPTHLPAFHQLEGLVVDEQVTLGDLFGTIETFVGAIFGEGARARFRPGYFPFTEPSAEFDISCAICGGVGCRTCSGSGWIELGGSGMVHPAVLSAVGVDPEVYTGFAFGFGIDRIAIMRHGIDDIRLLVDNDVRFGHQF